MIPKVIHQTFPHAGLPPELARSVAHLRARHAGWDYHLWDDTAMDAWVVRNAPEALRSYRSICPRYGAARADLFRYLLMYREGGVYLDIKSTFTRCLDETLYPDEQFILSHWSNGEGETFQGWGHYPEISHPRGEYQQCFIISAPGHPFLAAVIQRVLDLIEAYNPFVDGVGGPGVSRITGAVPYSLAIEPLRDKYPHRILSSEMDLGYVYSIYRAQRRQHHFHLFKHHYRFQRSAVARPGLRGRARAWLWSARQALGQGSEPIFPT